MMLTRRGSLAALSILCLSGTVLAQTRESPLRRGFTPPKRIKYVAPTYPSTACRAGLVVVEAVIDPSGRVAEAKALRSPTECTEAALGAVRQWEFEPTVVGEAPVWVALTLTVQPAPQSQPRETAPATSTEAEQVPTTGPAQVYRFSIAGQIEDIPAGAVQVVEFRLAGLSDAKTEQVVPRSTAMSLLPLMNFRRVVPRGAGAPGRITGRLAFAVTADGRTVTKTFIIYDDSLIQDAENSAVTYRAEPTLAERLRDLRQRHRAP